MKTMLLIIALTSVVWAKDRTATATVSDGSLSISCTAVGSVASCASYDYSGTDTKSERKRYETCTAHPDQRWCAKHPEYNNQKVVDSFKAVR